MSTTPPTRSFLGIRTATDALTLFEAVRTGRLPLIRRRLHQTNRDQLKPGQVFVWAESNEADGLSRWTDSRKWMPSKSRDVFLIYKERAEPTAEEKVEKASQKINRTFSSRMGESELVNIFAVPDFHERPAQQDGLVKQTFSAWVHGPRGTKEKWHMSAYLSSAGWAGLPHVSEDPVLRDIRVPSDGTYECCTGPRRNRKISGDGRRRPSRLRSVSPEEDSLQHERRRTPPPRPSLRIPSSSGSSSSSPVSAYTPLTASPTLTSSSWAHVDHESYSPHLSRPMVHHHDSRAFHTNMERSPQILTFPSLSHPRSDAMGGMKPFRQLPALSDIRQNSTRTRTAADDRALSSLGLPF